MEEKRKNGLIETEDIKLRKVKGEIVDSGSGTVKGANGKGFV
jgi:hypothetical protein